VLTQKKKRWGIPQGLERGVAKRNYIGCATRGRKNKDHVPEKEKKAEVVFRTGLRRVIETERVPRKKCREKKLRGGGKVALCLSTQGTKMPGPKRERCPTLGKTDKDWGRRGSLIHQWSENKANVAKKGARRRSNPEDSKKVGRGGERNKSNRDDARGSPFYL